MRITMHNNAHVNYLSNWEREIQVTIIGRDAHEVSMFSMLVCEHAQENLRQLRFHFDVHNVPLSQLHLLLGILAICLSSGLGALIYAHDRAPSHESNLPTYVRTDADLVATFIITLIPHSQCGGK